MGQLGELLRSTREEKGLSLAQAEAATMIRRRYLQALEDDDHAGLPGAVYIKGFLRNYAIYLGVDPNYVLSLYHREFQAHEDAETVFVQPTIKPRGTSQIVTGGTMAAGLLLVVLAIFSVYAFRQVQSFKQASSVALSTPVATPTPVQPTPTAVPAAALQATAPPALTPTPVQAQNAAVVTAKVSQDAWLQVQVDGKPAFEGVLKAGNSQTWRGQDNVFLWVGNAGGVNVVFNGRDMGALGAIGEVVKKDFKTGVVP